MHLSMTCCCQGKFIPVTSLLLCISHCFFLQLYVVVLVHVLQVMPLFQNTRQSVLLWKLSNQFFCASIYWLSSLAFNVSSKPLLLQFIVLQQNNCSTVEIMSGFCNNLVRYLYLYGKELLCPDHIARGTFRLPLESIDTGRRYSCTCTTKQPLVLSSSPCMLADTACVN